MELSYKREHGACPRTEHATKTTIEIMRMEKGEHSEVTIAHNEVIFFMEGQVCFMFRNFPNYEGKKGEILFLPAGGKYSYKAVQQSVIVIFRIHGPIVLCENYSVEQLYEAQKKTAEFYLSQTRRKLSVMAMHTGIWQFLNGIVDNLNDGISCGAFFDLKIKEFFMLVRLYYTKEDIYDFLYLILSKDTSFSEYVRTRWHHFRNVEEMAEYMHLTTRQFSEKFKKIFDVTPYKWMKQERAKVIRNQLVASHKTIKQIAFENGFSDLPQFTKFCKKEIGKTPTEIRMGKKDISGEIDN